MQVNNVISGVPYKTVSAGLHKKPTYMEVIDYIRKDPDKIVLLDRRATIAKNSHWLTQADGFVEAETQRDEQNYQRDQGNMREEFARENGLILAHLNAVMDALNVDIRRGPPPRQQQPQRPPQHFNIGSEADEEDMPDMPPLEDATPRGPDDPSGPGRPSGSGAVAQQASGRTASRSM